MGYEIGMDEGHDCQVQFQILHTCKQVQLRYALVNHEHKHVFPCICIYIYTYRDNSDLSLDIGVPYSQTNPYQ